MPLLDLGTRRLFYEERGEADECMVLLHGGGSTHTDWPQEFLDLNKDLRLLLPDLPGHGKSDESPDMTTLAMAADLDELLARADVARVHLLGFSMGANVALNFAIRNPDRLLTLTMIGANYRVDSETRVAAEQIRSKWVLENRPAVATVLELNHGPEWARIVNLLADDWATQPNYSQHDLAAVTCPVMLVHGDKDRLISVRQAVEMRHAFSSCNLFVVPFAGHYAHLAWPAQVADCVRRFVLSTRATDAKG